jgi:hypothetical protein
MATYSSTSFAGTDVSGAHIGDTEAGRLAALLKGTDTTPCIVTLSAAAEAANIISVSVQLTDANGDNLASGRDCRAQVLDDDGVAGVVAAWTVTGTDCTLISTDAQPSLLFTADGGTATLAVKDIAGGSGEDVHLVVEVIGGGGAVASLTFD